MATTDLSLELSKYLWLPKDTTLNEGTYTQEGNWQLLRVLAASINISVRDTSVHSCWHYVKM